MEGVEMTAALRGHWESVTRLHVSRWSQAPHGADWQVAIHHVLIHAGRRRQRHRRPEERHAPQATQMAIVMAMSPAARRDMVAKIAGLDASVLMTFKAQISLVDTVLRRIVGEDGTELQEDGSLSLKDALNLSLKVTQIMVRDLPKIYSLDRVQRQEEALRRVMETHLTREQQEALLEELEKIENPDAAHSVN